MLLDLNRKKLIDIQNKVSKLKNGIVRIVIPAQFHFLMDGMVDVQVFLTITRKVLYLFL